MQCEKIQAYGIKWKLTESLLRRIQEEKKKRAYVAIEYTLNKCKFTLFWIDENGFHIFIHLFYYNLKLRRAHKTFISVCQRVIIVNHLAIIYQDHFPSNDRYQSIMVQGFFLRISSFQIHKLSFSLCLQFFPVF